MFLSIVIRILCLSVLLVGWDMRRHSGWEFFIGFIIFIVGIEAFDRSCIWSNDRAKMPYSWDCPICRRKGKPASMRASDKRVIDTWRIDHNRITHLMEP